MARGVRKPSRYDGTISGPPTDLDDFGHWLNCWADLLGERYDGLRTDGLRSTAWSEGYQQAVRDIHDAFNAMRSADHNTESTEGQR